MSLEATLAAGTIVSFSLDLETPAYKVLKGAMSVGAVGFMAEAKEKTTLSDTNKKYGAGLQDAPDKSIKGQYYGSDTDQAEFLTAAKDRKTVKMKVEYPDKPDATGTGTIVEFEVALLGRELDDVTGEDWMMFTANGKQNSFELTAPVAGT